MGPRLLMYRVLLILRNFLRRLPSRLWQAAWSFIWSQLQKMRNKLSVSRLGCSPTSDSHSNPQISIQFSRVPSGRPERIRSSSSYELREHDDEVRLEFTSYGSHSASVPYIAHARESNDAVSDDSASDSTIPIQVLPPELPPSQSGDLIHYPDVQQGENAPVGPGLLWSTNRLSTDTLHNDHASRFYWENASHSLHSSPRSLSSSTSTLHNLSNQNISLGGQGSRVSVIISPVALSNNDLPDHRSFRADSTLEVADYVYPLIPSKLKRYKRNRILPTCESPEVEIRPVVRNFIQGVLPEGWTQHIHPEGRPTFYHEEKRIITESWIYDQEIYDCLTSSFLLIEDFVRAGRYEFPPDCHLVLDVEEKMESGDQYWCGYYYVSHPTRGIFWLEKMDISEFFTAAETEVEEARIKIQMEYQYWYHWGLFPNVNDLTPQILNMMANHIRDARTDVLTSPEHTVLPFSLEEINNWASVVGDAREQLIHGEGSPTTWFVGRFMSYLCDSRFHNFYGQYGARLARTQSIHGLPQRRRSYLIKTLSPLLFSAPNVHLKVMEGLWVDKLTLKTPWSEFFAQLIEEWKGHTVYASILLNANVAFLAIPSNDPGDDFKVFYRSPTQIASYLSVITSSASMLLALLLLRQYQTRNRSNVEDTNKFLSERDHQTRGLETLAILYSLPYALLVWGLVTFFLAFFIMCFQDSDTVTRSVVGVACLLAAILVVWCIWMGWEESQDRWWSPFLRWTHNQWNRKILGRFGEGENEGGTEMPYSSRKLLSWLWLLQLGRKPSISSRDAESLPTL